MQFQTNRNPERELTAPTERVVRNVTGLLINVCGLQPAGAQSSLWEQHYQEVGNRLYLHSVHDKGEEEAFKHMNTLRISPAAARTQRLNHMEIFFHNSLDSIFYTLNSSPGEMLKQDRLLLASQLVLALNSLGAR